MNLIVCIDDDFGMAFNNRRQSQDSILNKRIKEIIKENKLYISPYSESLFKNLNFFNLIINKNYLNDAGSEDYVFAELEDLTEFKNKINKIIVYRWNRRYPSDIKFPFNLNNWNLKESYEFEGSSHEKITEELYIK